jgi:endonuclease/exonuclease/phosphatase family metal-dependent hydrolase
MMMTQKYTRVSTVLFLLLVIFLGPCFGQEQQVWKIATFNVRYDNHGDREKGNGWDKRLPVILSLIKFHGFDVFGAQEVLKGQYADLNQGLEGYASVGIGRDDGVDKGEFAPIFYKKDKFKLINSGTFWLSETPDVPSKGWDASLPRICTWAQLLEIATGRKSWFFNLHMDHVGIVAREESARLVLHKMKAMVGNDLAFLTGDFNVDQNNTIYRILADSKFVRDSYEHAKESYALNGTFNAFDSNLLTESRIDHIFVTSAVSVNKYGVLTDTYRSPTTQTEEIKKGDFPKELSFRQYETRMPSDHFPVVVEVVLE